MPTVDRKFLLAYLFLLLVSANAKISQLEIKAVSCEICKLAVAQAIEARLDEESVDDLCEPKVKAGRWLSSVDITDNNDGTLAVLKMDSPGKCNSECSTAARACRKTIVDTDALLSLMGAQRTKRAIQDKICKKACVKGNLNVVVHREKDEEFHELDPKLAEMEDMMKEMKAKTGMGMKMYSRDDFASMSEGDMEAMAAREMLAQERAEARYMSGETPSSEEL